MNKNLSKLSFVRKTQTQLKNIVTADDVYHADEVSVGAKHVELSETDKRELYRLSNSLRTFTIPQNELLKLEECITLADLGLTLPEDREYTLAERTHLFRLRNLGKLYNILRNSADFEPCFMPQCVHQLSLVKTNVSPPLFVPFWKWFVNGLPDGAEQGDFSPLLQAALATCSVKYLMPSSRYLKRRVKQKAKAVPKPDDASRSKAKAVPKHKPKGTAVVVVSPLRKERYSSSNLCSHFFTVSEHIRWLANEVACFFFPYS